MESRKNLHSLPAKAQQSAFDRKINIQLFASASQNAERLRTLQAELAEAVQKGHAMAADDKTPFAELTAQQEKINRIRAQIQLLQNESGVPAAGAAAAAGAAMSTPKDEAKDDLDGGLKRILKSNEYARAFAKSIRQGITPAAAATMGDGPTRVLMDALTIAGGSPAGEDGGFLVPDDIDLQIRELSRAMFPISEYFNVETTTTNSGWRIRDNAPTTGFTQLDGEIPSSGVPMDDQPSFVRVPFSMKTYGLIVPVSNELVSDAAPVANLFGYLAMWFAKKRVIHDNKLLLAMLATLTPSNIAPTDDLDAIAQVKRILNKVLDPMISLGAVILTNQDGYDYLDQLVDGQGRPLMAPDPQNDSIDKIKQRRVIQLPNSILPSTTVDSGGATDGEYYPLYVGNFKEFGTLYVREGLEMVSTNIGGNAFRNNSVEVRGIIREDTSIFDSSAAVRRNIYIAE